MTQGVKTGGIAIRNPVDTAVHVHETSLRATSHLVTSMVDPEAYLNLEEHRECVTRWGQYGREERLKRERKFLDARGIDKPEQTHDPSAGSVQESRVHSKNYFNGRRI